MEKLCMNCLHWCAPKLDDRATCAAGVWDLGVPVNSVVLLPGDASCEDAFEPSDDYLDYLREVESQDDC